VNTIAKTNIAEPQGNHKLPRLLTGQTSGLVSDHESATGGGNDKIDSDSQTNAVTEDSDEITPCPEDGWPFEMRQVSQDQRASQTINVLQMTPSHCLSTLSAEIHHLEALLSADAPGELIDRYSGFVGTVICGLLLREGLDHPDMIRMASQSELEQVIQRISCILTDPHASAWYFSALDRLSIGHAGMTFHPTQKAV